MKQAIWIVLLLFPLFSFTQTNSIQHSPSLKEASPKSVGMSPERLARIDAACEKAIAMGAIPGGVALVAKDGKIIYHKAFGTSNSESKRAFQKDDIFRIASQTKAITATAVMMLWEEGHFQLDDPISKWIPEFKNPKVFKSFKYADTSFVTVAAKREITIRHLLTHTSGIGYGQIDSKESFRIAYAKAAIREMVSLTPLTTEENVKRIAKMPLHFHPGEDYSYGMGLDVLGYFVEIISGMSFDTFLQTRIFEPLAMHDTHFYLPNSKADRLVALQYPDEQGNWQVMKRDGNNDPNFPLTGVRTLCSGGGGLSSTAKDYANFLQMYLNKGELNGKRLLSRTTIKSMMANQIGDFWGDNGSGYGLAFGVVNEDGADNGGQGSKGTFSWGGAFNTQYFADPEQQLIGIILKQTYGAWKDRTGDQFRMLVGQAVENKAETPSLEVAVPEEAGMSSERLARIDAICEKAIEIGQVPGIVALVARHGKIVYHKGFGKADNAAKKSLDKDAIFRIASQTKAITATAVMMLWEEGHFQLDDPIHWWMPEFKHPKILKKYNYAANTYTTEAAKSEITIRQLLTHTSGIGYGFIDPEESMQRLYEQAGIQGIAAQDDLSTRENAKRIASMPLHFEPGEQFLYSMGLDVLGAFIEIVSGKAFDVFVQERIFEPLGMKDTYFHLPESKANRLVRVQTKKDETWVHYPVTSYDPSYPLTGNKGFCSGGAGLVSTAKDYALFLQMYLNGGSMNGQQLLSSSTVQTIMGNHIGDFWEKGESYYGLAFGVVTEKGEVKGGQGSEGTFSWGGYFNTQYFADPEEGTIGILMKQTRDTSDDQTAWKFRQLVGQAVDD